MDQHISMSQIQQYPVTSWYYYDSFLAIATKKKEQWIICDQSLLVVMTEHKQENTIWVTEAWIYYMSKAYMIEYDPF